MSTLEQVKPPTSGKYEALVEDKLAQARQRIRTLDTGSATLGFLIGTLVYTLLGMFLAAHQADYPALIRLGAFGVFGLLSVIYLGWMIWLLSRRINPYYAARQVELVVSGAKNSLVNWLDLREQKLPSAIRGAVTQRAARDMGRANLEQAISARRTAWLGGGVIALVLVLIVVFFRCGPLKFSNLLAQAFNPFGKATIVTRTQLILEQPTGGDVTVPVGQAVSFVVEVEGRVPAPDQPDALKVLYHYHTDEPYEEQSLERERSSGKWVTTLPADEVQNGFWYKVAGGDAETPEFRVQVHSTPLFTGFDVIYHFRPYLARPDQTSTDPNLEAMRGTQVTLVAHTNRRVQQGRLDVSGEPTFVPADLMSEDLQAMRFRVTLKKNGSYIIRFTTDNGESNTDPLPYTIKVKDDFAPRVELTEPDKETHLPADGVLQVRGGAYDDFGVTALALRMRIDGEEPLQSKAYRENRSFRRDDGSYPQHLDYQDFVDLGAIKHKTGQSLQKGDVIEYWLEATDNCDYPGPQVGRSEPPHEIFLDDANRDQKKSDQEREQARTEQKQHEEKQDQSLSQENKTRQEANSQGGNGKSDPDKNVEKKAEQVKEAIKEGEQKDNSNGQSSDQKNSKPDQKSGQGSDKSESSKDSGQDQGKGSPKAGKSEGKDSQGKDNNQGQENSSKGSDSKEQSKSAQKGSPQSDAKESPSGKNGKNSGEQGPAQDKSKQGPDGKNEPKSGGQGSPNDKSKQSPDREKGQGKNEKGSTEGQSSEGKNGSKDEGKTSTKDNSGHSSEGENGPKSTEHDTAPNNSDQSPKGADGQGKEQQGASQKNPGDSGKENQGSKGEDQTIGQKSSADQGAEEANKGQSQGQPKGTEGRPGNSDKTGVKGEESKAGAEKSDPGQSDTTGENKADNGNHAKTNGENTGKSGTQDNQAKKDLADLAKKLDSQDPKVREEARQKLSDLQREAKDPKVQQAAKDALEKASHGGDQQSDSDVQDLAKKPQSGDAKTREEAAKQLQDLEKNARDSAKQQAAADALKNAGESPKADQGEKTAQEGTGHKDAKDNEGKSKEQGQGAGSETGKQPDSGNTAKESPAGDEAKDSSASGQPPKSGAQGKQGNSASSDEKGGTPGASRTKGTGGNEIKPNGSDQGKGAPQNGGQVADGPGAGLKGNRDKPLTGGNDSEPGPATAANPENQKKAGELQLEEFKKKKDIAIDKLHWTDQQWQRFLNDYEAMLRRRESEPAPVESLADPKREGGSLANTGAQRVTGGTGTDDKLQYRGPALPPPQFREAHKEWTEKMSDLERAKQNK